MENQTHDVSKMENKGRTGINQILFKLLIVVLLMVLIVTVVRPWLTSQKTYEVQTQYLDSKMANANMTC